jgi:hypothetical protein
MAEKGKRPMNPLLRDTSEAPTEPSKKVVDLVKENVPETEEPSTLAPIPEPMPAPDRFDRSAMPKIRRRRSQKFTDLYDPLSTYIDKAYVEAFETLIEKQGPNKTAIVNEAIYALLKKHKETLALYGIDTDRLPIPRY